MNQDTTTGRILLYGMHIDAITMDDAVERCMQALQTRRRLLIGVLNASKVVAMGHDVELRNSLLDCDLMLADGMAVVWASRLLGRPLPERVTGIDLFERLLERAAADGRSVFLLGAKPAVLSSLVRSLTERFPGLTIAGTRDGYFSDDEAGEVAEQIRESGADMLFLGMTSPKKENFLARYGAYVDVPVQHGVGGSFDIFAGVTRRAPISLQRFGFEWLYRVMQEPRRMWRRYLTTNSAFIAMTPREFFRPAVAYSLPHKVIDLTGAQPTLSMQPHLESTLAFPLLDADPLIRSLNGATGTRRIA